MPCISFFYPMDVLVIDSKHVIIFVFDVIAIGDVVFRIAFPIILCCCMLCEWYLMVVLMLCCVLRALLCITCGVPCWKESVHCLWYVGSCDGWWFCYWYCGGVLSGDFLIDRCIGVAISCCRRWNDVMVVTIWYNRTTFWIGRYANSCHLRLPSHFHPCDPSRFG